jgi:hypothetical protein
MIEFHVDSIIDADAEPLHRFVEEDNCKNGGLGAYQSYFRKYKTRKVLICIGQDKCIFKQFLVNKKAWLRKSGHFKHTPKDDGSGIMVSALQAREFGFGFPLFAIIKDAVNIYRRGKKYKDVDAANNVKKKVDTDPFVCLFEYGNAEGKEGYWSYDNMVLQMRIASMYLPWPLGVTVTMFFCLIILVDMTECNLML